MEEQGLNNISHLHDDIWLVPCIAEFAGNYFKPVYQPKFIGSKVLSGEGWSKVEDKVLAKIIEEKGEHSWKQIAREFNAIIGKQEGKKTRECKDRWDNYLDPQLNKGKWTDEEDALLLTLQKEQGSKWSFISQRMTGRTQHSVKNHWNTLNQLAKNHWPECTDPIDRLIQEKMNSVSSDRIQDSPETK